MPPYDPLPERSSADSNSAADVNKQQENITAVITGWIDISVALTYLSASEITTASDMTGIISVGMKLKITQTTVKYFDIVAIDSGKITVDAGTTYTVANAAITLPAYSTQDMPFGWDTDWWSYTPSLTNLTLGNGTIVGVYKRTGPNIVQMKVVITLGSTSSVDGDVQVSPPSSANITNGLFEIARAVLRDVGTQSYEGQVILIDATHISTRVFTSGGSYVGGTSLSSTVPFTWTTGDIIELAFIYMEA